MTDSPRQPAAPPPAKTSALRSIGFYGINQGMNMLVPLVTLPIFTRLIGPEDYGRVDMLGLVMVAIMTLGTCGLHTAFTRFHFAFAGDPERQQRLLGTVVGFTTITMVVLTAAVMAVGRPLATWLADDATLWPLLMLIVLAGVARDLFTFFLMHFRNREQAKRFVAYDALHMGVAAAAAVLMIVVFRWGVYGLFQSGAGLIGYGLVLLIVVVRIGVRKCFRIDGTILRECLVFGWPLMTKKVVGIINTRISIFVVGILISKKVLGVYGRANGLAYVVFALMVAAENVYLPRWNKVLFDAPGRSAKSLGELFTEYACFTTFPALCLILLAHEIITVLLAKEYHGAEPLMAVLACYYTILAFQQMQGTVLNFLKMTKSQLVCAIVSCAVLIGLLLVLLPWMQGEGKHLSVGGEYFGAMGAAVAMLCSGLVLVITFQVLLYSRYRVGYQGGLLALMYGGVAASTAVVLWSYYGRVSYTLSLSLRLGLLVILGMIFVRIISLATLKSLIARVLPVSRWTDVSRGEDDS